MLVRGPATMVTAVIVACFAVAGLAGCQTAPRVGPPPGTPVESVTPSTTSPSRDAGLTVDVVIDFTSVSPMDKEFEVPVGQSVVLKVNTDHDVTVTVEGPQLNQSVLVGRKLTIPLTFVARQAGTITVKSEDPDATIARFSVG